MNACVNFCHWDNTIYVLSWHKITIVSFFAILFLYDYIYCETHMGGILKNVGSSFVP